MDLTVLLVLSVVAGALGVLASQLAGPVANTWPSATSATLLQRVHGIGQRAPGPRRRVAGSLAILVLMVGASLAAYIAMPAAPRERSRQIVAAVLAEAFAPSAPAAAAKPVRAMAAPAVSAAPVGPQIPRGATGPAAVYFAAPVAPPANPSTASAAELAAYQSRINTTPMAAPLPSLTAEQTTRFFAMSEKIEQYKVAIRLGRAPPAPFFSDDLVFPGAALIAAALGADAGEYNRYLGVIDVRATGPQRAEVAANPITGPDRFYLPARTDRRAVMAAAGVDPRGSWLASLPDANGGVTMTRISVTSGVQQTRDLAQVQAALRDADAIRRGADPAEFGMTADTAAAVMATMPRTVRAAIER